jgi:hypothetical protein
LLFYPPNLKQLDASCCELIFRHEIVFIGVQLAVELLNSNVVPYEVIRNVLDLLSDNWVKVTDARLDALSTASWIKLVIKVYELRK